jgi:hypothetical protein
MSEFYMDTTIRIMHPDGWGYQVSQEDDDLFSIHYVERSLDGRGGLEYKRQDGPLTGIWTEALPLIASALMQLHNQTKGKPCPQND